MIVKGVMLFQGSTFNMGEVEQEIQESINDLEETGGFVIDIKQNLSEDGTLVYLLIYGGETGK